MSKKKIKSIEDYVNSTKKDNDSGDFLFIDPFTMLPVDGLALAIIAVIIIVGTLAFLLFVH
jgi:hypothetical protein